MIVWRGIDKEAKKELEREKKREWKRIEGNEKKKKVYSSKEMQV